MTSYHLSVCTPSNREHQGSRASISTAINFKSDLVPKYINFYKKSLEKDWGSFA